MNALQRFLVILLLHLCAASSAQETDWVFTASGNGNSTTKSIFPDKDNEGVYGAGFFEGVTDDLFYGQSDALNAMGIALSANGPLDGLLFKLDNSGEPDWVVTLTGVEENAFLTTAQLSDGTVLAGGYVEGSASLFRGEDLQTTISVSSEADRVGIICAFDTEGNYLWHQFAGNLMKSSMVVDITPGFGVFYALAMTDGSSIPDYVSSEISENQYHLGCYDTEGNSQWVNHFGHADNDAYFNDWVTMHPRVDHFRGFTAVIGYFNSSNFTVNHATGDDTFSWSSDSGDDLFILLFDEDGSLIWAQKALQSGSLTFGFDIAVNCEGVYITGTLHATPSNPALLPGGTILNNGDHDDIFIARLALEDGLTDWAFLFVANGSDHNEHSYAIDTDEFGNVFIGGQFHTAFGPEFSGTYTSDNSHSEGFIVGMNSQGTPFWAEIFSGSGDDVIYDLHCNGSGSIYLGGQGSALFSLFDFLALTGESNATVLALQAPTPGSYLCCHPLEPGTLSISEGWSCPGDPLHFDYADFGEGIHTLLFSSNGADWSVLEGIDEEGLTVENPQSGSYRVRVESSDCESVYSNSIEFTVQDTTPPELTCAVPLEGNLTVNCGEPLPDLTSYCSGVDACTDVTAVQDIAVGTLLDVGNHNITVTLSDESGNQVTQDFSVSVYDVEAPVIDCLDDQMINVSGGCNYLMDDFTEFVSVTDECSDVVVTQVPAPASSLSVGAHIVVMEATDTSGNTTECTFVLTVADTGIPDLICDGTQTVTVNATCIYEVAQAEAYGNVTDNCGSTTLEVLPAPGTHLSPGMHTLVLTATDEYGNSSSCSFELIVEDEDYPVFSCNLPNSIEVGDDCTASLPDLLQVCNVADVCGILTTSQNPPAGTALPPGDHLVQIVAEDLSGNVAEIFHEITVLDNSTPQLICLEDQERTSGNACTYELEDFTALVQVNDNCEVAGVIQSPVAGTLLNPGVHEITLSANDNAGNSTSCSFTVEVIDTALPELTCVNSYTFETAGCSYELPDLTLDCSFSDNCAPLTVTQDLASGSVLAPGAYEVTITAVDASNNVVSQVISVTVADNEAPTLTCLADQVRTLSDECMYELEDLTALIESSDACGLGSVVQSPEAGVQLAEGTHEIIFTSSDVNGNISQCSINLTLLDEQAPVLTCPQGIVKEAGQNCVFILEDYASAAIASDGCGELTVTQEPVSGTSVAPGIHTIELTAEDTAGNSTSCSFTVEVVDTSAPELICNDSYNFIAEGCGYSMPDLTLDCSVSDHCAPIMVTQDVASGSFLPPGTHEITITAVDASNNSVSQVVSITIIDDEAPELTCPEDQTRPINQDCTYVLEDMTGLVEATDNCGVASLEQSPAAGTEFTPGTYELSFVATDESGKVNYCTISLTVVDDQNPTLSCSENLVKEVGSGCVYVLPDYTSNGNMEGDCGSLTVMQQPVAGTPLEPGIHTIELTAEDTAGNSTSCSFTVEVVDTFAPELTCNDSYNFIAEGCGYSIPDLTLDCSVSDHCAPIMVTQDVASGSFLPPGTHEITITAVDASNNSVSQVVSITIIDDEAPELTCPEDQTRPINQDCTYVLEDMTGLVEATDNCGVASLEQSPAAGTEFTPGTYELSFVATDESGKVNYCTISLTVVDDQNPTLSCSENLVKEVGSGCVYVLPDYTSNGNMEGDCGSLTVMQQPVAGTALEPGIHTIELTAEDTAGNSTSCSFTVEVVDTFAPELTCNDSYNFIAEGCGYSIPDLTLDCSVSDHCAPIMVTQDVASGSFLPPGTHEITITAVDASNNSVSQVVSITIIDDEAPELTCPEDQTRPINQDCTYVLEDMTGLVEATDNCGVASLEQSPAAGTEFTPGTYEISFVATDESGKVNYCTISLLVSDDQVSTLVCSDDQVVEVGSGCVYVLPDYTSNGNMEGDCGSLTVMQQPVAGTALEPGIHTIELTAEDTAGNSTSCSFTVEVIDSISPELTCSTAYTFEAEGCGHALPDLTLDCLFTDYCEPISLSQSVAPDSILPPGSHVVTVTATDLSGNSTQVEIDVIIEDNAAPIFDCSEDLIFELEEGCGFVIPDFSEQIIQQEPCEELDIVQTPSAGQVVSAGVYTIELSATDASGNTGACTMQLEVVDDQMPEVDCSELPGAINADCEAAMPDFTMLIEINDCHDFTIVQTPAPDQTLEEGPLTVTFNVTDSFGNSTTCEQNIQVNLSEGPEMNCPALDEVTVNSCTYELPDFTNDVMVSGACGSVSIEQQPAAGTIVSEPMIEVVFTASDDLGSSSCSSELSIIYQPEISISCPNDISQEQTENSCGAEINYAIPEVMTCGDYELTLTAGSTSGEFFDAGITTVSYTAMLATGASASCSFQVEVIDLAAPEVECISNVESCSTTPEFSEPEALDACSTVTIEQVAGPAPESTFEVGETLVVWHVSDEAGNTASCSTLVQVHPLPQGSWSSTAFELCEGDDPLSLAGEMNTTDLISGWNGLTDDGYFDPTDLAPGTYEVSALLNNGNCDAAEAADVTVHANPVVNAGSAMSICGMQATLSGSTNTNEYSWQLPEGLLLLDGGTTLTPLLEAENYTSYEVGLMATSTFGCEVEDAVTISFIEETSAFDLGEDLRVNAPAEVEVILPGTGIIEYDWLGQVGGIIEEGVDVLNLIMNEPGTFELLVSADNEPCPVRSDTLRIEVLDLLIPNGFSPNGDGDNDTFSIRGIDRFNERTIRVYDRNGHLVYESDAYANEWDGNDLRGRVLPEGTYYATVRLDDMDHSGFVILERE